MLSRFAAGALRADLAAIGSYVPGDPSTDNGCDIQTALHYWMTTGMPDGRKIVGYVGVDGFNIDEVRTAIWLFENVIAGIELPDAWLQQQPPSTGYGWWDVAGNPNPNNGHCIQASFYGRNGIVFDTWGEFMAITNRAMVQYTVAAASGELYAVISQDIIDRATQRAPAGFDWTQLVSDFDAMGGTIKL